MYGFINHIFSRMDSVERTVDQIAYRARRACSGVGLLAIAGLGLYGICAIQNRQINSLMGRVAELEELLADVEEYSDDEDAEEE